MSFSDTEFDDNLNPDNYLDSDNENDNDFVVNKNITELDNDDNENDYIDDDDNDNDNDNNDETYDPDDPEDLDDENDIENNEYIEDNINFNDNDLDNDSIFEYIVKSEDKITSNILTIYEMTELISIRATQISNGSYIFTDISGINDPMEMAKKEIIDNRCPLYVKRYIGLSKYELWSPNLMIKPKI
jgi:DNA-directed RNA polymerase subunit K/omega